MIISNTQYFDRAGNKVATAAEAYCTQVGNLRTYKDKPPERLVDGVWVPMP